MPYKKSCPSQTSCNKKADQTELIQGSRFKQEAQFPRYLAIIWSRSKMNHKVISYVQIFSFFSCQFPFSQLYMSICKKQLQVCVRVRCMLSISFGRQIIIQTLQEYLETKASLLFDSSVTIFQKKLPPPDWKLVIDQLQLPFTKSSG